MSEEKLTINPTEEMLNIMQRFDKVLSMNLALKEQCVSLINILTKEIAGNQNIKKKDGSTN